MMRPRALLLLLLRLRLLLHQEVRGHLRHWHHCGEVIRQGQRGRVTLLPLTLVLALKFQRRTVVGAEAVAEVVAVAGQRAALADLRWSLCGWRLQQQHWPAWCPWTGRAVVGWTLMAALAVAEADRLVAARYGSTRRCWRSCGVEGGVCLLLRCWRLPTGTQPLQHHESCGWKTRLHDDPHTRLLVGSSAAVRSYLTPPAWHVSCARQQRNVGCQYCGRFSCLVHQAMPHSWNSLVY